MRRNEWQARLFNNDNNWIAPELWQPLFKNSDKAEFNRMIFEAKKLRIMMRGVKSGKKKGASQVNMMSVFETGKKKE